MKKILISLAAALALTLTGCAEKGEKPIIDETSTTPTLVGSNTNTTSVTTSVPSGSVTVVATPTTSTATPVESKPIEGNSTESKPTESKPATSTASNVEKPAISSTVSSEKPAISSTTSSEKPTISSTKPVEAPTTSNVEKPTVSSTTSSTKPVVEPAPAPSHNCNRDGHIWGNSYTKVETEPTEVVEYHDVAANGYDYDLAYRYSTREVTDWDDVFGPVHGWGNGTSKVKTTGTKTTTKYFHDCTECGVTKMYDSTEEITDIGTDWEWVNHKGNYNMIWYDIDNIPQKVYDDVAREDADKEDFLKDLIASGNW